MGRHERSKAAADKAHDKLSVRKLAYLNRSDLLALYRRNREMYAEWIRRMVLVHHRVDILAGEILGYKVEPHHLRILKHQFKKRSRRWTQILVFRGAGKSTMATVTWAIFLIILCPNIRILIASKTKENSEGFLREIKAHLETNEKLRDIFGDFVGNVQWDAGAIEVRGRTSPHKEPTINTVGVGGAVASKHYDVILADDLVDEENSRTKFQRDKMVDWFYKVLVPTLMSPDKDIPFSGSMHVIGTRYHYEDLYGHLSEGSPDGTGGEMRGDATLTIPVLVRDKATGQEHSTWEEKFSTEDMKALRLTMGLIRFNSQYQCDCDAMKGQIFKFDACLIYLEKELPDALRVFIGADLAISEAETSDMFALVVIGIDALDHSYTLDFFEDHLRFHDQTSKIISVCKYWKPRGLVRCGIESNAYQAAQVANVVKDAPELKGIIQPIYTDKDKVTRAMRLSPRFDSGRSHFKKGHERLVEHLVLFPGYRYKDLFDAYDIAHTAATMRVRKRRAVEPGLF